MTLASSLTILFAGPSPAIVAGILLVAIGAATVVLWTLVRLVVDPRRAGLQDRDPSLHLNDTATGTAYDDSLALARGDGTG